jgi:DNA mismatch endonuclease, patch repair protein
MNAGRRDLRRPKTTKKPPDRSAIMRAVKSNNTSAELTVRRILRPLASGYRLHRSDIPGKPDVAFVGRKKAIFVHGCFWHGHGCPRGARVPKTNADYWLAKIGRNRKRDIVNRRKLRRLGWSSLVIWECELRDAPRLERRLRKFLAL